jgi:hypothetical protein
MEYRKLTNSEYTELSSRILYEDNHLLIVNKNVGEIVQGDKTGDETISDKYKAFIAERDNKPGKVFLGIPHRLDRPVSGITILAKTSKALERMTALFRDGNVHKTYWALVYSEPNPKTGELDNFIVRNEKLNKSFIVPKGKDVKGAKQAKLIYSLIGHTDRYFLVEIQLLTGRHHQIRCQLSGIGCTIKGDLKYGASRSNPDGGISLHARKINFIHPIKKEEINITAPLPSSWKGV